ncbi:unnamed protein product [Ectocarpus sp. 12 AP-2014]
MLASSFQAMTTNIILDGASVIRSRTSWQHRTQASFACDLGRVTP